MRRVTVTELESTWLNEMNELSGIAKRVARPGGVVLAIVLLAAASSGADEVVLKGDIKLRNVEVVDQTWQGYTIRLSPRVQLAFLREEVVSAGSAVGSRSSRSPTGPARPAQPMSAALAEKLQQSVDVSFLGSGEIKLDDIVTMLTQVGGIRIVIDEDVLQSPALTQDTRFSLSKENVQLIDLIEELTKQKGLSYKVEQDVVHITLPPAGTTP